MYQRIVLAYDGSREGLVALREGALIAKRFGAQVYLLSVLPQADGARLAESVSGDVVGLQLPAYREVLARGVSVLRELGFDPTARLLMGEPAPQIGAFARSVGADLVVLGHRRQSVLQRWWSGSAGAYVSDHVQCSVLIGRHSIDDDVFASEMRS
jgi:nucleotide-binding universal stress UspA family protein